MKQFFRNQNGFALILTLVMLPVFIGLCALVIDVGRAFNAQADMQAAADALALAGARELDGQADAITRANTAMAKLKNHVSFLKPDPSLEVIDSADLTVLFLKYIPDHDDTPIDASFLNTSDKLHSYKPLVNPSVPADIVQAEYIYVQVAPKQGLLSYFLPKALSIGGTAVAKNTTSSCDVAPVYICNPFGSDFASIVRAFDKSNTTTAPKYGYFQGRLFRMASTQKLSDGSTSDADQPIGTPISTDVGPAQGNFGFLDAGNGAKSVAEFIAGGTSSVCVNRNSKTQPGKLASVSQGFNTRFDMYDGSFGLDKNVTGGGPYAQYFPALDVTREPGLGTSGGTSTCNDPQYKAYFSRNFIANTDYATTTLVLPKIGSGTNAVPSVTMPVSGVYWNLFSSVEALVKKTGAKTSYAPYWQTQFGTEQLLTADKKSYNTDNIKKLMTAISGDENFFPSRYDMYRYEIAKRKAKTLTYASGIPSELPSCNPYARPSVPSADWWRETINPIVADNAQSDRRTMNVAVVDCLQSQYDTKGGRRSVYVQGTVKIFLVGPMDAKLNQSNLDFEVIGVNETGKAVNSFVESVIVR